MSCLVQPELFPLALAGGEEFIGSVSRVTLTLLVTERCNYQCAHCLYACSPARPSLYMPDEVLEHVGRALEECGRIDDLPVLNVIGGEASIDLPELSRVIRWIGSLRSAFRLSMVSNGWWLQNPRSLAKVADAIKPLWEMDAENLRIGISNTPWHDRFRTPHLQAILRHGKLADILEQMERWHPAAEVRLLDGSQRRAIAEMAEAAREEKLYVQHRYNTTFGLICMGRAEENGMGRRSHSCSADDLSLTIWPDGSIRHICDGAGKIRFGHIRQGIVELVGAAQGVPRQAAPAVS